jgi:hypothetical protein
MITVLPPPHRQPLRFEIGETRTVRFDFGRCLDAAITATVTLTAATLAGHVARALIAVIITDPSATILEVDP